jgi:hypothetical protein
LLAELSNAELLKLLDDGERVVRCHAVLARQAELPKRVTLRIPTQSGHSFRREGGRRSDLKPVHRSDLKAATVPI